MIKKSVRVLFALITVLFFFSCKTTENLESPETNSAVKKTNKELSLVFGGDIMAHTGNFLMKDYSLIWTDIKDITQASDFTFGNLEAPVDDTIPFENYPTFNMKFSYPEQAIKAGFNVFSLANNHTNDQSLKGIYSTQKWANEIKESTKDSNRPVYFSGLRKKATTKIAEDTEVTYEIIEKNGVRFLFLAVTQILNTEIAKAYINYFPDTKYFRSLLIQTIQTLREENPCDFFVLGLHIGDPEYVLTVTDSRKKFCYDLLDAGVDIIWANHPHTIRPIEYIKDKETQKIKKIIMYACGNTISAQRWRPNFANPGVMREYTGDGLLLGIKAVKNKNEIYFDDPQVTYFTTYVDPNKNTVIRKYQDSLYTELEQKGRKNWADYLRTRYSLLLDIKEIITWQ